MVAETTQRVTRRTADVEDAAAMLGISPNSVRRAIRRGDLIAIRIGKRLLIPIDAIERVLAGRPSA